MAQTTDPTLPDPGATAAAGPAIEGPVQGQSEAVISGERTPKQSPKRTRVVVRKVGPWSVLKLSLIFYFVVMLIWWGALLIVYAILGTTGAITSLTKLMAGIGLWQASNAQPTINGNHVFTWLFIGGVVAVVIWSIINCLVALAYNLVSDVVGGLELTLAESKHRD